MFVRFGITFVLSSLYMWYTSVPDFPFGKPEVRRLLALRGIGGTVGVFGFYCEFFAIASPRCLFQGIDGLVTSRLPPIPSYR
jgi:hypothetical protein